MTIFRLACFALLTAAVAACDSNDPTGTIDAAANVDAIPTPSDAYPLTGTAFVWQSPGGFAGTGSALEIADDGTIHIWDVTTTFDPEQPPSDFDRTVKISATQLSQLYSAWANTDFTNLPHQGGPLAECEPAVYVRTCATCTPVRFVYNHAAQLEPEMEPVFAWFDDVLINEIAANHPRNFCRF